jgi:serine/threonine-protein kinase
MKTDQSRAEILEVARSLVRKGEVDAAVRTFLRAGAFDEAAGALASVRRFADAGHLIMDSLGVGTALLGGLDADRKKLAGKAAVCFAQAGEVKRAVEIFLGLGDPVRAADLMEKSGDKIGAAKLRAQAESKGAAAWATTPGEASGRGQTTNKAIAQRLEKAGQLGEAMQVYLQLKELAEAARIAHQLGRFAEAAQLYENAAKHYEAAVCYSKSGDTGRCLDCLVRVGSDHPQYRMSCVQAIKVSADLNVLDFKLDHFLTQFLRDAPRDAREAEALYVLGKQYRTHDFPDSAREVYEKILAVHTGGYRDVAEKLAAIDEESKGSRRVFEAIVRQDAAFHGEAAKRAKGVDAPHRTAVAPKVTALPDLPDLPPLAGSATNDPVMARPIAQTVHASPDARPAAVSAAPAAMSAPPVASSSAPAPAPAAASVAPLAPGLVVNGRYRLDVKLGEGGMASVYRATDIELGETIAMKFFMESSDEEMISRFKQELTLSRQLTHPNIVRLYDIGSHGAQKFITMELLEGRDLGALHGGRAMEVGRALGYLIQACEGLAVAHERGIVHRDIKPANFFVTKDDVLKVMDFGIAKGKTKTALTRVGFIAGTPEYMSPEQITAFASVTQLSDLYSLGIVAYELVTGTVPFEGELVQILHQHAAVDPVLPRMRKADIPKDLEEVIMKLLEKEPAQRVQSCRELATILRMLRAAHAPA